MLLFIEIFQDYVVYLLFLKMKVDFGFPSLYISQPLTSSFPIQIHHFESFIRK